MKTKAIPPVPKTVSLPGDNGELEPPDPISNSEVKQLRADDSVDLPMRK